MEVHRIAYRHIGDAVRSAILIILILLLVLVPHAAADAYVPTVYIQKTLNDLVANNSLFRALFDFENYSINVVQLELNSVNGSISGKEPTIIAGTTSQFLRGNKTWGDIPACGGTDVFTSPDAINILCTPQAVGIGIATTNQMNKTASDNDTASRLNDTRHQALFDLLNATNAYFNLSLLNNNTFFNASLTGINLSLANNFSYVNASLTGINASLTLNFTFSNASLVGINLSIVNNNTFFNASLTGINLSLSNNFTFINASLVGINSTATDLQLQIKNNATFVNGTFVAMNNGSYVQTNNVSYVQVNNISYVQVNNGSYVQTNNVSYVQVNNASYVQTNNATYLQFPVGNLTYLFKLNATTCTGTDKSQFNGTNFICAADQTGATGGVNFTINLTQSGSAGGAQIGGNATIVCTGNASCSQTNTPAGGNITIDTVMPANLVRTDNASYVQTNNGSYVQTNNASYVQTNNVSYVQVNNASYVQANNATYLQFPVANLTYLFKLNATTCSGTDKSVWNGTTFICATDQTGASAAPANVTWSQTNITNISKNYTVDASDATVLVDSTKGSINISIPHYNISGRILTFKKVDASVGNMSVQSAHMFMGNESNTSRLPSVWQGQGAPKPGFNQTYFFSFNITNMPFNISRISLHVNQTGTGSFNASLYNDTGGNKPYVQLDSTANTSTATPPDGGYVSATFNGTQLNLNTEYWIGLQLRNVSVYVGNATYEGVTVFNLTNNNSAGIMPHIANYTALNQTGDYRFLVPEIALNFSSVEGNNVMGTAVKYGTFRLQWDNNSLMQWWKV